MKLRTALERGGLVFIECQTQVGHFRFRTFRSSIKQEFKHLLDYSNEDLEREGIDYLRFSRNSLGELTINLY